MSKKIHLCAWDSVHGRFNQKQLEMFARMHRAQEAKATDFSGEEFTSTLEVNGFSFAITTDEVDPNYPNEVYINFHDI